MWKYTPGGGRPFSAAAIIAIIGVIVVCMLLYMLLGGTY